jgi:tetratricopeptide (TPR) repeat protein
MNQSRKKILLATAIFLVALAAAFIVFRTQDPNDVTRIYSAADFPAVEHNDRTGELIRDLNVVLTWLRENSDVSQLDKPSAWRNQTYNHWLDIGNFKRALQDYDGSRAAYERAIEVDDSRPLAYLNLGTLYKEQLGDYPLAELYYMNALERISSPFYSDYEVISNLYEVFYTEKEFDVEQFWLDGITKISRADQPSFYKYLYDYFKERDPAKSEEYRTIILDINPDFSLD